MRSPSFLAVMLAVVATACSHSLVVERPKDGRVDAAYTALWTEALASEARDGDIVLRRGYAVLSDVITMVARGPSLSHAALYDGEKGVLVEATAGGVKETTLEAYVAGAHRVVIIRPRGISEAARRATVVRARSAIGTPFDYAGFVGAPSTSRFYCSELILWAMTGGAYHAPAGRVIAPSRLVRLGPTIYDSGDRGALPLAALGPYWRPGPAEPAVVARPRGGGGRAPVRASR